MKPSFDVIVVGGGAAGCFAAAEFSSRGIKTLLLEAGPLQPAGLRAVSRQSIQATCYAYAPDKSSLFVDDKDNPYTSNQSPPFEWIRTWNLGGRTSLWGLMSLRFSDFEFQAADRDGFGENWPLRYAELAPYYDQVEAALEVSGTSEGIVNIPDGCFKPSPSLNHTQRHVKESVAARWPERKLIPGRYAKAVEPISVDINGRAATLFGVAAVLLPELIKRDELEIRDCALVEKILLDGQSHCARGVSYFDTGTGERHEVQGANIFLAASAFESVRILLSSRDESFTHGIGGSSGVLGRYVMDHTNGVFAAGATNLPAEGPITQCYIPNFRNITQSSADFLRGYGLQLTLGLGAVDAPGGGYFAIETYGEVLPRYENALSLDLKFKNRWGIPALNIDFAYSDNEHAMAQDQIKVLDEIIDSAGFTRNELCEQLAPPGRSIHELGGARMGTNSKTSVLDSRNRVWDCPNVLVGDGACFTSSGFQNPALTIMAISLRAATLLAIDLQS